MDVSALTKLLSDSPLPAVCALLVLAVVGEFAMLMKAHARERATLEKVATLAAALVPLLAAKQAQRRRRGDTGTHAVVAPEEEP